VSKFAVIFGGAQKNIGNAGITITIVKKSLLPPVATPASPEVLRDVGLPVGPVILDWPSIAKENSLYNTLPIFDVWIAGQVMSDLVQLYRSKRVRGQEEVSAEKAKILYRVLDSHSDVYQVVPDKAVRSRMNICFRVHGGDATKEKEFLAEAEKIGFLGLKGHRSVGEIRVSNSVDLLMLTRQRRRAGQCQAVRKILRAICQRRIRRKPKLELSISIYIRRPVSS
jgi:phosphoserine aminotransferase